jgi:hypothetical protein
MSRDVEERLEMYSQIFDYYIETENLHPSVQDDILAQYIQSTLDDDEVKENYLNDLKWRERLKVSLLDFFHILLTEIEEYANNHRKSHQQTGDQPCPFEIDEQQNAGDDPEDAGTDGDDPELLRIHGLRLLDPLLVHVVLLHVSLISARLTVVTHVSVFSFAHYRFLPIYYTTYFIPGLSIQKNETLQLTRFL